MKYVHIIDMKFFFASSQATVLYLIRYLYLLHSSDKYCILQQCHNSYRFSVSLKQVTVHVFCKINNLKIKSLEPTHRWGLVYTVLSTFCLHFSGHCPFKGALMVQQYWMYILLYKPRMKIGFLLSINNTVL